MLRALAVTLLCSASVAAAETRTFGKPLGTLKPSSLSDVLAKPEAGASVRLEGTIDAVCRNKGCWLTLSQGERSVHVTFAGYSFFVPKDVAGRKVVLEGKVVVKEREAEDVAHLEKEGATRKAAGAAVSIEATGVQIRE